VNASKKQPTKSKVSTPAKTRKGAERKKQILDVCIDILVNKDASQLTMRNIASELDLHLSNVQYYFPTRDDIIKALVEYIAQFYTQEVDDLLESAPSEPLPRFFIMIDYLLEDIRNPRTRRLFLQLWGLLGTLETDGDKILNRMYLVDIANISRVVAELNPLLTKGVLQQRATLIAAIMEGMMLMYEDADTELEEGKESIEMVLRKQALRIALDP